MLVTPPNVLFDWNVRLFRPRSEHVPDSICALHNEVHLIARVYSMSLSYTACGGIAGTDVACLGCVCCWQDVQCSESKE